MIDREFVKKINSKETIKEVDVDKYFVNEAHDTVYQAKAESLKNLVYSTYFAGGLMWWGEKRLSSIKSEYKDATQCAGYGSRKKQKMWCKVKMVVQGTAGAPIAGVEKEAQLTWLCVSAIFVE